MRSMRSRTTKVGVTSTAVMLAGVLLSSARTQSLQATAGVHDGRDWALDPPEVESLSAIPLGVAEADGNALLLVRFAEREQLPPRITAQFGGRRVMLRDDGQTPDMSPGDHVFSAVVFLDFHALATNQERVQMLNRMATASADTRGTANTAD